jgi:hypothetical protein
MNYNVRFRPIADMPKYAIDVAIRGKADMPFRACLLMTQSGHPAMAQKRGFA